MAKSNQKNKARDLRRQGLSIKSIAKKTEVSVGSVSMWTRDIELTNMQKARLERNSRDPYFGRRLDYINLVKRKTNEKIERLRKKGVEEVGNLSKRELFLIGIALYWSEGFKKDSQVGFANSDPAMINLFVKWLIKCFGYNDDDLSVRVTLNISHRHRIKEIEKHWSEATRIPLGSFRKPFFQRFVWKKVYENPNDYYGLLRVKVLKSKDFLRKIHGYIEGLRLQSQIG